MDRSNIPLTLVDHAAQQLRREILSGALAPSGRIRLSDTAERLGMSPIPVREALRMLAAEALVEVLPQKGYRVRPISARDLLDTYGMRLVLDPMAVERAVPKLDQARLKQLEDAVVLLGGVTKQDDWARARVAHRQVHFGIYEAAGSPWLHRFLSLLWENSERYQRLSVLPAGTAAQRAIEHQEIVDACRLGDAKKAAMAMREHLTRTLTAVTALLADSLREASAAEELDD